MVTLTGPDPRIRQETYPPADVVVMLLGSATMSAEPNYWVRPWFNQWTQGVAVSRTAENPIGELRRVSGLTWDQIGQIMGVDRRTLHLWEAGRAMRPKHQERLQRVLQVVRKVDRGQPSMTRRALLDAAGGPMLIDLLAGGEIEEALRKVEALPYLPPHSIPTPLSLEAKRARRGRPVAEQVDLIESPVDTPKLGLGRPARVTRVERP